ncbi:hypothetical protein D9M68_683630 [compost metagenome]
MDRLPEIAELAPVELEPNTLPPELSDIWVLMLRKSIAKNFSSCSFTRRVWLRISPATS